MFCGLYVSGEVLAFRLVFFGLGFCAASVSFVASASFSFEFCLNPQNSEAAASGSKPSMYG
jgi:hypothetical protein